MPKIEEAQAILAAFGLPPAQQNEMAALTLLALCHLKPDDDWQLATRGSVGVSKGIMTFIQLAYGRAYAPNTRETFRRQVLHQFVQARLIDYNPDNPLLATNSPKAHYALTSDALAVIRSFGAPDWMTNLEAFKNSYGSLQTTYQVRRAEIGIALMLPDGIAVTLSPGAHNLLQAQVITQFAPQFASDAVLLYLGDTADKDLYVAVEELVKLGIPINQHDKLPDIILYLPSQHWLYLIEVVTSHGPMTPKRVMELRDVLQDCDAGKIFVSAFPNFTEFRKHMRNIAWETEVWLAEAPDHLIHFNGDRFLGPRV
jgi:type II restriction enzyme